MRKDGRAAAISSQRRTVRSTCWCSAEVIEKNSRWHKAGVVLLTK